MPVSEHNSFLGRGIAAPSSTEQPEPRAGDGRGAGRGGAVGGQGSAAPPVSEGGAPAEEDGFRFRLRLIEEPKKGVILHTNLPEVLTRVSATQQELQCVLVRSLETNTTVQVTNSSATFRKQVR